MTYKVIHNALVNKVQTQVWQFPSKEEEQHTFRTIPREHWLIGSVHGTPKLTIKKLRPARFARPAQFIT